LAFLDKHPMNPGHTLLVPKKHVEDVFDLDDELLAKIFLAAKRLSGALKKATEAKRIGVAIEGFTVPHAHVHLVPLHNPSDLNPERAVNASEESLAEMCEKIRNVI
jgi:histidine triad (HIT) family protein